MVVWYSLSSYLEATDGSGFFPIQSHGLQALPNHIHYCSSPLRLPLSTRPLLASLRRRGIRSPECHSNSWRGRTREPRLRSARRWPLHRRLRRPDHQVAARRAAVDWFRRHLCAEVWPFTHLINYQASPFSWFDSVHACAMSRWNLLP